MFQFPGLAPFRVTRNNPRRVSPFGHLRVIACLPANRSFSQAPTSFIASDYLGILHVPFVALIHQYALSKSLYLSIQNRHCGYHYLYTRCERTIFLAELKLWR